VLFVYASCYHLSLTTLSDFHVFMTMMERRSDKDG